MALFNAIQHTQITPRGWHVHLVHYVHKDGSDGSLSNHQPLALNEVLRKVSTSIAVDRVRRDWSLLKVLGECNPGFQAGRTTANVILPVRTAAEHCVATKTEMAVLLDGLKWCFDTPANAAIELALMRLGVPAFYVTMLNDIDTQVRAARRGRDPNPLAHRGARGTVQTDQAPQRGRRRHGLLGGDGRTHPHGDRRSEPRLACAADGRGGGLQQLVPGPGRPAAVLQPDDAPNWSGWRR